MVSGSSGVLPQLYRVKLDCTKCGYVLGLFYESQNEELKAATCPKCLSLGPFEVNQTGTLYKNYQRINIQEAPGQVTAGRLPRSQGALLMGDLCDTCRPGKNNLNLLVFFIYSFIILGDKIELIGVYSNSYDISLNTKNDFPVFTTIIIANHIVRNDQKSEADRMTDDNIKAITAVFSQVR